MKHSSLRNQPGARSAQLIPNKLARKLVQVEGTIQAFSSMIIWKIISRLPLCLFLRDGYLRSLWLFDETEAQEGAQFIISRGFDEMFYSTGNLRWSLLSFWKLTNR